ncbi:unnamed protein product [Cladocopium goreaui]|uniref:Uncharacterized protein n=1 Tax=Cladocopium goreaui TaxID=2562237 RepID=A0A9P1GSY4_9DINO|nr:unnamed protein product [Cladocopium goreaui]
MMAMTRPGATGLQLGQVGSAPAPAIAADNSVEVTTRQIELGVKLKHCTPSGKTHEETAAEMTSSQNE